MKTTVIIAIFLIGLTGCAGTSLISHGIIQGDSYVSNVAGYTIKAPGGWVPTLIEPEKGIERKIGKKLARTREIGYISKVDGSAHIIIEIHSLTWAKEPVMPLDITFNSEWKAVFTDVCNKMMVSEQSDLESKFSSSTFECFELEYIDECLIKDPCLESTRTMVSSRPFGNLIFGKVYIVGDDVLNKGWRIHFTLASPPDEYQENSIDFEQAINSISRI